MFLVSMYEAKSPSSCLVIGNGAIGTAIASRLSLLNFNPSFVGRRGPVYIKSRFEGWGKTIYLEIKPLSHANLSKVKIVFMAVKAFDLAGALERYIPYFPKGIPIISLSNGAIEDLLIQFSKKYSYFKWRIGTCTFGVTQVSDDIFSLRSERGKAYWGPLNIKLSNNEENKCSPIEEKIIESDKGTIFQWHDNIIPVVRKKWLCNVVMNSICAANFHENNGKLLNDIKLLQSVFDEAFRLGQELWGPWPETYDKSFENLVSLISSTAENENSMARDIRLHKKTENDFLAKLSDNRRGYDLLKKLSKEIESNASPVIRGKRRK